MFGGIVLLSDAYKNMLESGRTSLSVESGYVHWLLTGEKVLGVGEASGMFPIDSSTGDYDCAMCSKFASFAAAHGVTIPLLQILPRVLTAGEAAGVVRQTLSA